MSLDFLRLLTKRGSLGRTTKLAAGVCVVSLGLVHTLAPIGRQSADRPAVASDTRVASRLPDPEVTGSIGTGSLAGAARSIALDPCSVRERLIVRGP